MYRGSWAVTACPLLLLRSLYLQRKWIFAFLFPSTHSSISAVSLSLYFPLLLRRIFNHLSISFPLFLPPSIYPFSPSLQFNYFLLDSHFTLSSFSLFHTHLLSLLSPRIAQLSCSAPRVSDNVIFQLLSPERECHSACNACSPLVFLAVLSRLSPLSSSYKPTHYNRHQGSAVF